MNKEAAILKKPLQRLAKALPQGLTLLAALLIVLILTILLGFQSAFSFAYESGALLSNLLLMPFVLLFLGLCGWAYVLWQKRRGLASPHPLSRRRFLALLCLGNALLLPVQLVMVRSLWFFPAWDPANCWQTATQLATGQPFTLAEYFGLCPNNAPISLVLTAPMWVGVKLGLAEPFILLPSLGAFLMNLASLFAALSVERITRSRAATLFCYGLSTVFLLLSPYLSVPYTDSYAVLFPILALYFWLTGFRPPLKWFLVALAASLGAAIKPTVWIVLVALLLVKGFGLLASLPLARNLLKRVLASALALLLGLLPGIALEKGATLLLSGSAVPQGQLSATHYLMLGMNSKTYGGHSPEDVEYSLSFPTLEERQRANVAKAWERVAARGLPQNLRFFAIKLYKAYNSGTFAFNGSFLPLITPKRTDPLSLFLRSVYDSKGALNPLYRTVYQGLWLLILVLCALALFLGRKRYSALPVMGLVVLGVSAYLMLFEVWPRYLFLYSPVFVALAALGMREVCGRLGLHRKG